MLGSHRCKCKECVPWRSFGDFPIAGKVTCCPQAAKFPTRNLPKKDIEAKTENQTTSYHEQRRNVVSHKVLSPLFLQEKWDRGVQTQVLVI